ncbi:AGAP006420-PA-like protein [Anopheles sinensis]|uniref:AGAP006420-PA-like protein n=1 Tax=Anopheles sinensis TaxID=74873 RepID=A0A084VCK0_ANOSI|nr:AGAP006420-PA-like protein [Anopheles sinensis]
MPTLIWDDELARQAGHNARSCVYAHDVCRNTKLFRYVGQNLAHVSTTAILHFEKLVQLSIQGWWDEFNVTTQAQLDRFPEKQPGHPIGHFTQMISDRAWKMGCAAQTWFEGKVNSIFYMVCNYSFANYEGQPVYRRGLPASRCRTGENADYPGLCSTKEQIFSTPNAITN